MRRAGGLGGEGAEERGSRGAGERAKPERFKRALTISSAVAYRSLGCLASATFSTSAIPGGTPSGHSLGKTSGRKWAIIMAGGVLPPNSLSPVSSSYKIQPSA